MMRYLAGLVLLAATAGTALAEAPAEAVIRDWDGRAADIMAVFRQPVVLGAIAADGTVQFDLPADIQTTQPFGQLFSCSSSSSSGGVQLDNPDATYTATSTSMLVGRLEKQELLGGLIPASSEATAVESLNMTSGDTPLGTLYQWMYFSAPAGVTGECATTTAYQDESGEPIVRRVVHDMNFAQGWNLVEVNIQEVQQPAGRDHSIATLTRYRTIDAFPDDTVWVFAPKE